MHPAGLGVDLLLEGVSVGALELRELPPVENQSRALDALGRQSLKLVHVGRILPTFALPPALQAETPIEHFTQLLRRSDGERPARRFVDLLFARLDVPAEFGRQSRKILAINLDPAPFHAADHRDQRLVDAL